jgi:hypothetical protein
MPPSTNKPPVYLFVIVPILAIGGIYVPTSLLVAYSRINGILLSAVPNLNAILIWLPAFCLWIPISLLLGNVVLHCVPSLRLVAERYVRKIGRPGFLESQMAMLKALLIFASICIPVIVLGFVL